MCCYKSSLVFNCCSWDNDISQGSVVTHLRCGRIYSKSFIANCLLILTLKELWKSVNIWWSYEVYKNGAIFGQPCRSKNVSIGSNCSPTCYRQRSFSSIDIQWIQYVFRIVLSHFQVCHFPVLNFPALRSFCSTFSILRFPVLHLESRVFRWLCVPGYIYYLSQIDYVLSI